MSWTARALLAGAAVLTAMGGGRLAWNEVRLAGHEARRADLDRRDQLLAEETARTGTLELELAEARLAAGRAEQASSAAAAAVTSMRLEMGRAEAELLAAESRAQADAEALATLRERRAELERSLAATQAEALDAQHQAALLAGRVRGLEADLTAQRESLARLDQQARATQVALDAARGDVARLEAEAREARGEADRASGRAEARARELEAARTALAAAEQRARAGDALLARLRAEGVKVDRLSGQRPVPAIRGMVLRVDPNALPMEVLVDAGSRAGLEAGDRLWIVRGSTEAARLEVSEVRPDSATARVLQADRLAPPRPGDTVLTWRPGRDTPP